MYFGKSLGRVGADFSALIPHVFQMRMYDMVKSHLERGLETFEKDLRDIFKEEDLSLTLDITAPDLQDITSTPPSTLLVFPFVAALTNTFLSAFNELRQCAVLTLQDQLRRLQKFLHRMVQTPHQVQRGGNTSPVQEEQRVAIQTPPQNLTCSSIPYVVTYMDMFGEHTNVVIL